MSGTEAWQFELRGVPSISVYNWHREFARTDYHTTRDTQRLLDYGLMADLARLYLELLTAAEAAGDRLLDYAARARDVRRSARRWANGSELADAAGGYARDGSRRAFARLARRGFAVDAHGAVGYLPEQAAADVRCLDRALDRLQHGDRSGAAVWAGKVGENRRTAVLSPAARSIIRRRRPRPGSWAAHAHLTRSPDLAAEIAALRGDRSARPFGSWVEHSLRRARDRQAHELARRTDRLLAALSAQSRPRSRS